MMEIYYLPLGSLIEVEDNYLRPQKDLDQDHFVSDEHKL